jgi:hypothetical protein
MLGAPQPSRRRHPNVSEFDAERNPWIAPNAAPSTDVSGVVKACYAPSTANRSSYLSLMNDEGTPSALPSGTDIAALIRAEAEWVRRRLAFLAAVAELRSLVAALDAQSGSDAPAELATTQPDSEFVAPLVAFWTTMTSCGATVIAFVRVGALGGYAFALTQLLVIAVLARRPGRTRRWARSWLYGVTAAMTLWLIS